MISCDQGRISKHMNAVHSIKVEEDTLSMKLSCHLCDFGTHNMSEYKKHLINDHKKKEHNWMVDEVKATFNCGECKTEFPDKVLLANHIKNIHMIDGLKSSNAIMPACSNPTSIINSINEDTTFPCNKCEKHLPNDNKSNDASYDQGA